MFILNKVKQLRRVRLSHKLERLYLQRSRQPADHSHSLIFSQRFLQHFLRVADTAFRNILLRKAELIKLICDRLLDLRCDTSGIRDL